MFVLSTCHSALALRLLPRSPQAKVPCQLDAGDGVRVCGLVLRRRSFKTDREEEMKTHAAEISSSFATTFFFKGFDSFCVCVCARARRRAH